MKMKYKANTHKHRQRGGERNSNGLIKIKILKHECRFPLRNCEAVSALIPMNVIAKTK